MVNDSEAAANDEESQIDAVMRSWAERPCDSWTFDEKEVVRHHVSPRTSLFSPARTGCLIPLNELSVAHLTVMKNSDGTTEEQITPNWKNSLEAHRKTDKTWTGKTMFYRLQSHGDPDPHDLRRMSDEALFRLFDPEDALDREMYGSEYACQVEGVVLDFRRFDSSFHSKIRNRSKHSETFRGRGPGGGFHCGRLLGGASTR